MPRPRRLVGVALLALSVGVCLIPAGVLSDVLLDPARREYVQALAAALLAATASELVLGGRSSWMPGRVVAAVLLAAVATELLCALGLKAVTGRFHLERGLGAFRYHPALVGVPTPGYRRAGPNAITHNSVGFRGPELDRWWRSPNRVALIGGSTTYDLGVPDGFAWPVVLEGLLGEGAATMNMGIPGHSTAEHVILAGLLASEFRPTVIVYYVGLNDIANSHFRQLTADYANPHLLEQFGALQVDPGQFSRSAMLTVLKRAFAAAGLIFSPYAMRDTSGRLRPGVDGRLLALFERNVRLLIAVSRAICAEPILVPQVLNRRAVEAGDVRDNRMPYVARGSVGKIMSVFNSRMMRVGKEMGAPVIDAVLDARWDEADFVDSAHFSPSGSARFASIVAAALRPRLVELGWRASEEPGCPAAGSASASDLRAGRRP